MLNSLFTFRLFRLCASHLHNNICDICHILQISKKIVPGSHYMIIIHLICNIDDYEKCWPENIKPSTHIINIGLTIFTNQLEMMAGICNY